MKEFSLYRKRIIPNECILLKHDDFISFENNNLVTKWQALHPKKDLHHGISCYFFDDGIKVSKFYGSEGQLLYWYIDIISYEWSEGDTVLTVTDLLADVIIYPDHFVKVVDIDELSDALEQGMMTTAQLTCSLRILDHLLKKIYDGSFAKLQSYIDSFES